MYINHSCEPNAGIRNNIEVVAMKRVKEGQEIVFDYSMNNIDKWTMKCDCGSKHCRKIISTFDNLDEKTKKKYRKYLTNYVRKKYFS